MSLSASLQVGESVIVRGFGHDPEGDEDTEAGDEVDDQGPGPGAVSQPADPGNTSPPKSFWKRLFDR